LSDAYIRAESRVMSADIAMVAGVAQTGMVWPRLASNGRRPIKMAVREQHRIHLLFRRGGWAVQRFGFFAALEQAAIQEFARRFGMT